MEQHPVPRNITGFQFHLIGDMTLRQFAYLTVGGLLGFMLYKGAPFPMIITFPLALLSGFIGFAFAFLPIQERPLDKWLVAFVKSVLSPTQYLWQKNCDPPEILLKPVLSHAMVHEPAHIMAHAEANSKLKAYLATLPTPFHESLNLAEKRYVDKTLTMFQTGSGPAFVAPPPPVNPVTVSASPLREAFNIPVPEKIQPVPPAPVPVKTVAAASSQIKNVVPKTQPPVTPPPVTQPVTVSAPNPPPSVKPVANSPLDYSKLQEQLDKLAREKQDLENELQKLHTTYSETGRSEIVRPEVIGDTKKESTVKTFSPKGAVSEIGMPSLPQFPNIIVGIIKDPQKKLLPNIIITVKDKSGMPLRALKTNKLGQFATATPLPNGTYLLEVEDPLKRFIFDIAEIALSGKIFLPVEIIAKGQKEIMREQLTKELFGNASV